MYGKQSSTTINKLRYDSFLQKYQGTPDQALGASDGIDLGLLPPCRALFFFLLAEHHCKCRLKSQLSGIHISFRMCQALKGYNWKVADDGSFNFSGLVVKLCTEELIDILCDDYTCCQESG